MSAVYLDYNASGLVRPEVLEIMTQALADNGNPSAVHAAGRRARGVCAAWERHPTVQVHIGARAPREANAGVHTRVCR